MYSIYLGDKKFELELDLNNSNKGKLNGTDFLLDKIKTGDQTYHIISKNRSYTAELISIDKSTKEVSLKVNGIKYIFTIKDKYDKLLESLGMDASSAHKINDLKAPMPGLVLDIIVKEGDAIKKGDSLLVLEAMKMENILKSPTDAVVKTINIKKGIAVEKNQVLISFS